MEFYITVVFIILTGGKTLPFASSLQTVALARSGCFLLGDFFNHTRHTIIKFISIGVQISENRHQAVAGIKVAYCLIITQIRTILFITFLVLYFFTLVSNTNFFNPTQLLSNKITEFKSCPCQCLKARNLTLQAEVITKPTRYKEL